MENGLRFFECYWAVIRSGLYLTPVNTHLTVEEAAYIVRDSGAKVLIASASMAQLAAGIRVQLGGGVVSLMVGGTVDGFESYEESVASLSLANRYAIQQRGETMLYSSGTTGRPKGIRRPLSGLPLESVTPNAALGSKLWGFDGNMIYLCPGPLYHAAPLASSASVHAWGGTVVVMKKFDPVEAIHYLDQYRITHSQWVPTMLCACSSSIPLFFIR